MWNINWKSLTNFMGKPHKCTHIYFIWLSLWFELSKINIFIGYFDYIRTHKYRIAYRISIQSPSNCNQRFDSIRCSSNTTTFACKKSLYIYSSHVIYERTYNCERCAVRTFAPQIDQTRATAAGRPSQYRLWPKQRESLRTDSVTFEFIAVDLYVRQR